MLGHGRIWLRLRFELHCQIMVRDRASLSVWTLLLDRGRCLSFTARPWIGVGFASGLCFAVGAFVWACL